MMVIDLDEVYAGELGRAEASCWSPSSEPEHGDSYSTAAIGELEVHDESEQATGWFTGASRRSR